MILMVGRSVPGPVARFPTGSWIRRGCWRRLSVLEHQRRPQTRRRTARRVPAVVRTHSTS